MRPWATSTMEPTATRTMLCRKLPAVIAKTHSSAGAAAATAARAPAGAAATALQPALSTSRTQLW